MTGLGYAVPVQTPAGPIVLDVPLEAVVRDAVDVGWPILREKLEADLPGMLERVAHQAAAREPSRLEVAATFVGLAAASFALVYGGTWLWRQRRRLS